jgi:FkbM family methyltransferase
MNNKHILYEQIKKYNIKNILDIGANIGQFAKEIKSLFPEIFILCIEPNIDCEPHLKLFGIDYIICCPSDSKTTKKFYRMKNDPIGTGHSLYKENTHHYEGDNLLVQEIQTDTIDSILANSLFKNISFDFIKLDTQGSELDILKGSSKTLSECKMILAETDIGNYNEGCASQKEIIKFVSNHGFETYDIIENQISEGKVFQQDILFLRKNLK